jgi:hypothetical protein
VTTVLSTILVAMLSLLLLVLPISFFSIMYADKKRAGVDRKAHNVPITDDVARSKPDELYAL